jgi:hypothetical protein
VAEQIAFNDAGFQQRITKGNELLTELTTTKTAMNNCATAVAPSLKGGWGNSHQTAMQNVENALERMGQVLNNRNVFLNDYRTKTWHQDDTASQQTTASVNQMTPIVDALSTAI